MPISCVYNGAVLKARYQIGCNVGSVADCGSTPGHVTSLIHNPRFPVYGLDEITYRRPIGVIATKRQVKPLVV